MTSESSALLTDDAHDERQRRSGAGRGWRLLAFLLALVIVGVSGWVGFAGALYGFGLKCDELCSNNPSSWREDPDAWQWHALGWSSVVAFGCALLLLAALIARRRVLAWLAAGGWLVITIAVLVLFGRGGPL